MADTPINSANSTAATEREIILSIVQDELLRASKLRPTVWELPAPYGAKSVAVPKFSKSFEGPEDINPDGLTTQDFQNIAFDTDVIELNKHKVLPYRITDRAELQSAVNAKGEAAKSAGKQMGIFIDEVILSELRKASSLNPDHVIGLDGKDDETTSGDELTLEGITKARMLLNKQNLVSERWLVLPPEQEKTLLDLDNFKHADKYGARDALLDGEVGKVYGFRVMVHNGVAGNECFAYEKEAVAIAVQQEIKFESQRADVRLQATDYAFTLLMGSQIMDKAQKVVYLVDGSGEDE